MQPQHKQSAPHTAQRGTSLIEILVVLVILVIGILSIVRLFPAGFIALRNAQNATFADRLAQGALEQLKKSGNGLPEAIYMYSYSDTAPPEGFDPNFAPDNLVDYTPSGSSISYNNINKQRYISNETITVPAPHVIGGMPYPPLYVVNYGPIFLPSDATKFSTFLPVNSIPWTPQRGDSRTNPSDPGRSIDNPTDILQPGQQKYVVDYDAGAIAVPQASYDQNFYVQVTLKKDGPQDPVFITVPATVSNPASGYNGYWFSRSNVDGVTGADLLPDSKPNNDPQLDNRWASVTLYRPFQYKGPYVSGTITAPSTTFDSDPYEFALYATNMGANANTGVIAFNPLAAGQNGSQPLKARISYMTLDWHILHEDQDVAEGSPSIRLTLNHLKRIGDTQFDQTIYTGLVSDATTPADVVMLNLDTGAVINLAAPQNGANGGLTFNDDDNTGTASGKPLDTQYIVSYQNGRITFPKNSPAQHLRFYYAGDADWALAVQKASSSYRVVNVMALADGSTVVRTLTTAADYQMLTTAGPPPNSCVIDTAAQRAYFPISDAGKTVEFDGITYTSTASATPVQIGEASTPISTDYARPANAPNSPKLPYVNLSNYGLKSSGVITSGITADTLRIAAIRGVSARATVIWHERNRWRTRSIDTLLTQTQ